jgi:23S rRNA pseudouridine2605 synthase
VASRRAAEKLIGEGRVRVDGRVVTDPARDVQPAARDGKGSTVSVDGSAVVGMPARVVYMVHKPPGVLSTASDPRGRPTVVELVDAPTRLYPVGRLDADSSGLILLTNDGELANRLTHPRFGVPKTYRARVRGGPIGSAALRALRAGVALDDGPAAGAQVTKLAPDVLELTIREGRNRQVKRMCEAVGHPVISLERVRFGALDLGSLPVGRYRRLRASELGRLMDEPG